MNVYIHLTTNNYPSDFFNDITIVGGYMRTPQLIVVKIEFENCCASTLSRADFYTVNEHSNQPL